MSAVVDEKLADVESDVMDMRSVPLMLIRDALPADMLRRVLPAASVVARVPIAAFNSSI